jgi:hypothetical protein
LVKLPPQEGAQRGGLGVRNQPLDQLQVNRAGVVLGGLQEKTNGGASLEL